MQVHIAPDDRFLFEKYDEIHTFLVRSGLKYHQGSWDVDEFGKEFKEQILGEDYVTHSSKRMW